MVTQNIYEYKKVKPIEKESLWDIENTRIKEELRKIINKVNELCIEQNHLMKDFELYKKAFKRYVGEHL